MILVFFIQFYHIWVTLNPSFYLVSHWLSCIKWLLNYSMPIYKMLLARRVGPFPMINGLVIFKLWERLCMNQDSEQPLPLVCLYKTLLCTWRVAFFLWNFFASLWKSGTLLNRSSCNVCLSSVSPTNVSTRLSLSSGIEKE